MRVLTAVAAMAVVCGSISAQKQLYLPQSFNPENAELSFYSDVPMMRSNARLQAFYDATEVGSSAVIATGIALRYDGPIPKVGQAGPFTIQRLQIDIGTSSVALPGAVFDANLSQKLTTALDQKWQFMPDPGSRTPGLWGGPSNTLNFPFRAPVVLGIPQGGWLVVDMKFTGNDIGARTHALVDAAKTTGGPQDGSAVSSGTGCGTTSTAPPAKILTSGVHAPGAAHSIWGQNLGANALVVAMIGASDAIGSFGALPTTLPGTACRIFTSWDFFFVQTADANGSLTEFAPTSLLPIPAETRLSGITLYEQLISIVPSANVHGLVTSDKRTVKLGSLTAPAAGIYAVSNSRSASAAIADLVEPVGYALRLEIR